MSVLISLDRDSVWNEVVVCFLIAINGLLLLIAGIKAAGLFPGFF